ncbi:GNAT family N-acetyltransferase [Fictibacillus sp. 18YEL24]|uniref:GNAT family N-acetyltransferase n=1 Tax=Fictibacillus sp. 18YEL24 TaxID=2745875 RepID=UPI0018CD659C|nr:GNAT family protein [Fictibacillus sp. 18YEL24]MBH0169972.1 GNAT family N-acetyltransferase [Fictibacillus sp. 18YEL24]
MLQKDRIRFREMLVEDWKAIHQYASQEIVSQYQPWGPNHEKDSIAYVNEVINDANRNPRERYAFAIVENQSNLLIGAGELQITSLTNRVGEIGYVLHPDYWGKGFATEAGELLLKFGFEDLQLHRIFATCDPRNKGSEKVLKKLDMKLEGIIRESILLKDRWRDSMLFSMLEHEWTDKKGLK